MQQIVIQKFGGRLLETPERIRDAAKYIIKTKLNGEDPVVVVSAPGQTTDHFHEMVKQITDHPDERELDMLLSVGERTAMALLAMAINADGRYRAVSFTGSQVGIITDTQHTDARILEVKGYRIREALDEGNIPIICGFQGVSIEREITTLGRGGSDTTAVALAVGLNATSCELVKEVGCVYSADPDLIPEAVKHPELDYITLQALTNAGAKVVHPRAVSLASQHKVKLNVTGTDNNTGTLISDYTLTKDSIAGIVLEKELFFIKLSNLNHTNELIVKTDWKIFLVCEEAGFLVSKKKPDQAPFIPVEVISVIGQSGVPIDNEIIRTLETLRSTDVKPIAVSGQSGVITIIVESEKGVKVVEKLHAVWKREFRAQSSDC